MLNLFAPPGGMRSGVVVDPGSAARTMRFTEMHNTLAVTGWMDFTVRPTRNTTVMPVDGNLPALTGFGCFTREDADVQRTRVFLGYLHEGADFLGIGQDSSVDVGGCFFGFPLPLFDEVRRVKHNHATTRAD